jgi:hypothetical protein
VISYNKLKDLGAGGMAIKDHAGTIYTMEQLVLLLRQR